MCIERDSKEHINFVSFFMPEDIATQCGICLVNQGSQVRFPASP